MENPQLRVLVIGGGSMEEALKAEAETLGISDIVRFTGFVYDVAPYYGLMDLSINCFATKNSFWKNGWSESSTPSKRICRIVNGVTAAAFPSSGNPRHGGSSSRRSLKRPIQK